MTGTVWVGLPALAWLLIAVGASAVAVLVYAYAGARDRERVLRRAVGDSGIDGGAERSESALSGRFAELFERIPGANETSEGISRRLIQAGFDAPTAPVLFNVVRATTAIGLPVLGLMVGSPDDLSKFVLMMVLALAIGVMGPTAVLDRMIQQRQDTIRKGIPDTLDLLVVCLEAGVALDAAMQRVARELKLVHVVLSNELVGMSRRMAAGVPREQAMQSLYTRTGVDELRSLASHMIQSEKWGTSIVTVLRVYGDQLRRKRRMEAEKRAATASTRMLFPLMVFIFPTIFVVLLGPAMMRIGTMFSSMGG